MRSADGLSAWSALWQGSQTGRVPGEDADSVVGHRIVRRLSELPAGDALTAFYNEIDPFAAQWCRNLIDAGEIMPGIVDERSIHDVQANDLLGFDRCHFFAGIAGWELALRLAGWDHGPVWTGSCPCQPFSQAGARKGEADSRHLWPEFRRLISECRPSVVLGEQVSEHDGVEWVTGVRADLEAMGYAAGVTDLCSASEASPNRRQRLFWVAYAERSERWPIGKAGFDVGDRNDNGRRKKTGHTGVRCEARAVGGGGGARLQIPECSQPRGTEREARGPTEQPGSPSNLWNGSKQILCRDGRFRRISSEPSDEPLAARLPQGLGSSEPTLRRMVGRARRNRVGRLRGYGNSICPQVAATFIRGVIAFLEAQCHAAKQTSS